MRGRYLLALSVALTVLLAPSLAFADDGFIGGLQDLVGIREVEQPTVTHEQEYLEEYEPVYAPLATGDEVTAGEGDEIQTVVDSFNTVPWSGSAGSTTLFGSVRRFFLNSGWSAIVLGIPAGLVFFWWGARKSLRILMGAWRKGHASV